MTMQEYDDSASYAEGTQKKVSGEVIRWHHKTGPVRVPAEQHIQALENEVKVLKQQVSGDSRQRLALITTRARVLLVSGTRHIPQPCKCLLAAVSRHQANPATLQVLDSYCLKAPGTACSPASAWQLRALILIWAAGHCFVQTLEPCYLASAMGRTHRVYCRHCSLLLVVKQGETRVLPFHCQQGYLVLCSGCHRMLCL